MFAEVICVKADVAVKVPNERIFKEACTTVVSILATGRGLYQKFGLPWPGDRTDKPDPGMILIYGGSSSMGTILIRIPIRQNVRRRSHHHLFTSELQPCQILWSGSRFRLR